MDFDRIWDNHGSMKKSNPEVFPIVAGLGMRNDSGFMKPPLSASSSIMPSRSSSNSSNHSANRCTAITRRKELSPHWKDPKSLVESFVEVLNEHLQHSRNALRQLPSNSTITELQGMSSASIISLGFDALRGLLEKRNPTAIISIYAFCHIAYAAAIVVDDKSSKVRTEGWFQDSLCWLTGLSSERQKMTYTLIVQAIWKPQDLAEMGDVLDCTKLTEMAQSSTDHENRLIKACTHFLDSMRILQLIFQSLTSNSVQEGLSNRERSSKISETPPFNFSQASFYRTAKNRIIDELIQKISIEAFIEDVVAVENRLQDGEIDNLRQLELELICAGKVKAYTTLKRTMANE